MHTASGCLVHCRWLPDGGLVHCRWLPLEQAGRLVHCRWLPVALQVAAWCTAGGCPWSKLVPRALQVAALTDALQRSQTEVAELQHLQQSTAQQAAESAVEVRRLGGAVQQATAINAAELRAQEEQGAGLREETRKRQVCNTESLVL